MPFLKLLQRHPSVKIVLHYSGNLLLWMKEKHPESLDILRELVKNKRAEFLSGGFYEPILSVLPEKDRLMQIKELSGYIAELLAYNPRGMWLAERVWEPDMPKYLSVAGIEYLPLDDYHFKLSGLEDESLTGYYITEYNGCSIKVFPGSEKLRYYIPFRGVDETISYLREVYDKGGTPLLTLADDGEKFGVWPETHKHCYDNGWLENFFSALEENSHWLQTTTFSDYKDVYSPAGRVYLPTASYREMGEWVLPPDKGLEYEHTLNEMEKQFGDKAKSLLRGGIWRSFLSKYSESNHLHKRMLMISEKVHEAAEKAEGKGLIKNPKLMLHELWQGQCNDAYWHGIFGGLYLPHLRSSLYRHLINAETQAEEILSGNSDFTLIKNGDLDCNGYKDVCISNEHMTAFFSGPGGTLTELSLKAWAVNVLDTLTRRCEVYHSRLSSATGDNTGKPKTIHDRLEVKEEGLSAYLTYDNSRRSSLMDHFWDHNMNLDSAARSQNGERGDFINGLYSMDAFRQGNDAEVRLSRRGLVSGSELKLEKIVKLHKSQIAVEYKLEGSYSGIFANEFNISLLGSPYATVRLKNDKNPYIKDTGVHEDIKEFAIIDKYLKLKLSFSFEDNIDLWHYPIETVSLSEQGVERIYQGTAFIFINKVDFKGHKQLAFNIKFAEAK